jgi:hypothetical protein
MDKHDKPSERRIRIANIWAELERVCERIHYCWYTKGDRTLARRYLGRLDRILKKLPDNDMAIIREEGAAWSHQLKGENVAAIRHRQREIRLIEMLHEDVRRNAEAGKYDQDTIAYALQRRDLKHLDERRAMLNVLMEETRRN